MKKNFLSKTLVMCTVLLFVGVGAQSAFAVETPEKEEVEPQDYLYETIIAIANNPDVKELFEEHKNNIEFEFNNKYIFRQMLFKSPQILWPMVFTKTKTTTQYLDESYNQGLEIVEIFGEEKAFEMLDSVEITYSELIEDLNNIILVVVNLDPYKKHDSYIYLPISHFSIKPDEKASVPTIISRGLDVTPDLNLYICS